MKLFILITKSTTPSNTHNDLLWRSDTVSNNGVHCVASTSYAHLKTFQLIPVLFKKWQGKSGTKMGTGIFRVKVGWGPGQGPCSFTYIWVNYTLPMWLLTAVETCHLTDWPWYEIGWSRKVKCKTAYME